MDVGIFNEFDRHPKNNVAVKHQKNYMKAWLHDGWFWDQAAAFILLTGFFSPFFFHPKNFMTEPGESGNGTLDLPGLRFAVRVEAASKVEGEKAVFIGRKSMVISQGSLKYPYWGDQTIQIYGNFEGFPSY